jgi:predicted metal-dependent enzyme (double-stranded beta helix superfamily)
MMRIHEEIVSLCSRWKKGMEGLLDNSSRITYMKQQLPTLLTDRTLIMSILSNIVAGKDYPDIHYATMFDSEIILYRDPNRLFSLRIYLWDALEYDPVHDHNSWGVIGPALGDLEVISYQREDGGSRKDYASLVECERKLIEPGDTYSVLPLNAGIHSTGNPNDQPIVQFSVYGQKLTDRNYVNTYDLSSGRISGLFSPPVKKSILAQKALSLFEDVYEE